MDTAIAVYHENPIKLPPLAGEDAEEQSRDALIFLVDGLKLEKEQ